jgi:glycosyltransferase involved in cell wall biosynthesis
VDLRRTQDELAETKLSAAAYRRSALAHAQEAQALRATTSWRLTEPLRRGVAALRGLGQSVPAQARAGSGTLFSVCIPAYEMHGRGAAFLARSLAALDRQTLRDFEVVVSDHSANDELETLCRRRGQFYPLRHLRCPVQRGNSSVNTNFAVRHAKGEVIKVLHQDDFVRSDDALRRIDQALRAAPDRHWGGVGCVHVNETETAFYDPHVPRMHPMILHGVNRFGAPSLLFVKRDKFLDFDEELIWVGDCEVYYRMEKTLGAPIIVPDLLVAIRHWPKQVTHTAVSEDRKLREIRYAVRKHQNEDAANACQ